MTDQQAYPDFKTVYLLDASTGEFKGTYEAQHSPLDAPGTYITPVHSTDIAPPPTAANEAAIFSGGSWSVVPDFRGQSVYNQTDDSSIEISNLGPLPTGYSTTRAQQFILQEAFNAKGAALDAARLAACLADVSVSVGGVVHPFQADQRSVDLLHQEITLVSLAVITCTPVWRSSDNVDVSVTIDDLKNIAAAIASQTSAAYQHSFALKDNLEAAFKAGDLNGINSITW